MHPTNTLPTPSAEALAHSQALTDRMRAAILANGGSIPFQVYMQMALYEPGFGYYVAGLRKIGADGDFVTAPEVSPLFSACLANQCAQILDSLGCGDILELGAGSGLMAADMLLRLEALQCLPERYRILDVSPELRDRQYRTLQAKAPHLLKRVEWLTALPDQPLRGVVIGNEVLDAMPVELFTVQGGTLFTVGVGIEGHGFKLSPLPRLSTHKLTSTQTWAEGYTSEFNPALPGWMQSMAAVLDAGALVLIDYGYEQDDYYHPERTQGTLLCHYQHRLHDNPLLYPGLQDITASVDFTAVAEAGTEAGLELAGYTTQANFLANSGLEDLFIQALQDKPQQQYALAQQIRLLSLPAEMGERFKAIAFTKGFTEPLLGFRLGDRRQRL